MENNIKNSELRVVQIELSKISGLPLTGSMSMAIIKSMELVSGLLKSLDDARLILLKGYSELDEKNNIKHNDNKKAVFKSPQDEDKFYEEYKELLDQDSGFAYPKINGITEKFISNMNSVSPSQVSVLLNFIRK